MLHFYQMGHILHFSRYFTSFRQGSCLISLYPIFSPSFSEFSLSFPSLSSTSNPVSSISCAVPEFSLLPLSRTLEKGAFLQSAVTVSSSIASQEALLELCRSSTHALPQLLSYSYYAGPWLLCKACSRSIISLSPARRESCCSVRCSTTQHYTLLLYCAYSTLYN